MAVAATWVRVWEGPISSCVHNIANASAKCIAFNHKINSCFLTFCYAYPTIEIRLVDKCPFTWSQAKMWRFHWKRKNNWPFNLLKKDKRMHQYFLSSISSPNNCFYTSMQWTQTARKLRVRCEMNARQLKKQYKIKYFIIHFCRQMNGWTPHHWGPSSNHPKAN